MNEQVREYVEKYPKEIIELFTKLRDLIMCSAPTDPSEALWAKIPSYYVGERFVRLIPFKDHINIEASAILSHTDELADYKLTPKGMLQIYVNQGVPSEALSRIFEETLK